MDDKIEAQLYFHHQQTQGLELLQELTSDSINPVYFSLYPKYFINSKDVKNSI